MIESFQKSQQDEQSWRAYQREDMLTRITSLK